MEFLGWEGLVVWDPKDTAWLKDLVMKKPDAGHPLAPPPPPPPAPKEPAQTAFFILAMLMFVAGACGGRGVEFFRLILAPFGG